MTSSSQGVRARVRKAIEGQKPRTVTILSSLLAVHDVLGYLPREAIEEVALHTGSTVNDVWAVASFYPNFRFDPPTKHQIELCWGTSCHVMGASRLYSEALKELGLKREGDTPDGHVCLHLDTCMSVCSQGPMVKVDHTTVGRVTPEKLRSIIRRLRDSSDPPRNGHGQ